MCVQEVAESKAGERMARVKADLSQRLERSEESLIHCRKVIGHLSYQREDARAAFCDSKVEIACLQTTLKATQSMAEAGKAQMLEAADEYLEGYVEALLHIQTLFPGLDLQPYKPYMRVEGG